jgi:lysophospholipase
MKNTKQHGYVPVPNFLADTLSTQSRFHDLPSLNSVFGRLSRTNSGVDLETLPNKSLNKHLDPAMNGLPTHNTIPPEHATMNGTSSGYILPPNTPVNKIRVPCFSHLPNSQGKIPSLITPPSLYGKRIRYSILEYDPLLDSCNITMADWIRVATDIEANYELFDAFIVLHGTDTMAYTASALSFMLEDLG